MTADRDPLADPLAAALRAEAARLADQDPLAARLRADAARVAPAVPSDLAARTRARVRAEIAAPPRLRIVPWLAVAAAAALAVGVLTVTGTRAPAPAPVLQAAMARPVPMIPTPIDAVDVARSLPTADAPLDRELTRMRGDARATMAFLLDTLPVARRD